MKKVYRWIFKKVAQFHLRIWLPLISSIYNWYFIKKIGKDLYKEAVTEREIISNIGDFTTFKRYITSKYEWRADPLNGAIDWVPTPEVLIIREWRDDCDAFGHVIPILLKDTGLLYKGRTVTILPLSLRHIKRMHVVAEVFIKGDIKQAVTLSSGTFQNRPLTEYIKDSYEGIEVLVLDYYTGEELNI